MKELSPHEKEWFKLIYKIDYETAKQQWEGLETSLLKDCEELARAAAALCSEKIRWAIDLAREEKEYLVWSPSDRDWTEDFKHENGKYTNTCIECKLSFNGHKRRVICKKCQTPNWEEIAKRKPPEDTKDNKAWAGAWLEGEMVGYAKCMIEPKEETDLYTPDEIMQKLSEPQK